MDGGCRAELVEAVEKDPRDMGKPFSVWTCRDLAEHVGQMGYAHLSGETVRRWLHRLGYRIIRPVLSINSPDPDYEDEVDLNLLPGIIGCWTRKGRQRKAPTPGTNRKRYGFGAVDCMTGQLTYCIGERKNSDGFCELVEQIVREYCPGENWEGPKVVLVVDNYVIHRSKKTLAVLARYADRLTVMALPTYSPKLNIIELLWKYMRRKVTHNHLFASIEQLVEAVEQFFRGLIAEPATVLSVVGNPG